MNKDTFLKLLKERILILDGAMGSIIQGYKLTEKDYRGERFAGFHADQAGNNELLNITRPDVISSIYRSYLDVGVDIFSTNTFNANAISMADYDMQSFVGEMNLRSAQLARREADDFMARHPGRPIMVAGSVGPTNKTASMSPDVDDPAFRAVSYADLYAAYREQITALAEGGIDIILIETVFDTLNAKAALEAAGDVLKEQGKDLPIMLSVTLSAQGGRTFSGQTLEAFLTSVEHANPASVGLNCSFGAADMKPYLEELARKAPYYISAYPNAGLPNSFGLYDETPDTMAQHVKSFVDEGLVNILGGCCGTTPAHIARYAAIVRGAKPHVPARQPGSLRLSGLEMLEVKPGNNFVNIGERCNVAGSRRFLRLIKEGKYEEALSIARKQVEDGAQVIDINMDDGMLDAAAEMTTFLNLLASEPDIARVPLMIDASRWEVIERALMCTQGKSIVNSISLKEGEEIFLLHAARIKQLGAAAVVMAFDERGQADVFERKTEVCERAYRLLVDKAGFDPHNIIFDPNVLAIATGIEEHNSYGLDFIRAVGWIKQHLPGAGVSGGVSNLSFSFRGNDHLREAMHAVFLYHAIGRGMDMGIVNPASTVTYEDIEPSLRTLLEDVILCRRPEAAEELVSYAQQDMGAEAPETVAGQQRQAWRETSLPERLEYALRKGITDFLDVDLAEALVRYPRAVDIIDGPLMSGMNKVGELFGAGKMFLPQVVKTARTMKKAVAILQPAIEATQAESGRMKAGKVIFATVKGDVHDIGKNIVSIVLACNNYEVIDLGVMTPADVIVRTAIAEKPDLVCLSGLITPSLEEMVHVTEEMQKAGLSIPVMIGGATTSKLHTAVKIAPHYRYPVVHVADASQGPLVAARLLNPGTRREFIDELDREYEKLRRSIGERRTETVSLAYARKHPAKTGPAAYHPARPAHEGVRLISRIPVDTLRRYINWKFFFVAWKLSGRFAGISGMDGREASWMADLTDSERDRAEEAVKLYADATQLLDRLEAADKGYARALYGFFPAHSESDNIVLPGNDVTFPMLRQQARTDSGIYRSLADYVLPLDGECSDYIGAFALTAGAETEDLKEAFEAEGDTYSSMLLQSLSDRLAEAASEYLHEKVRREFWGYAPGEDLSISDLFSVRYRGIRPAIGYPSLPDQLLNYSVDSLLDFSRAGISLTENGAMYPTASVSGLYISHPEASYFMIGSIDEEQLIDYARRRNISEADARRLLVKNL
ncbi:MAG: methionine synthase [Tannerellaceae bacterium]|jgi:5-methyltetrahydrofolate--homocysteine methyltransferase|nr:methionine synthase [Tannerellaceae bacterium]